MLRISALVTWILILLSLGGCATSSQPGSNRKLHKEEEAAVGVWRQGTYAVTDFYGVMLRRAEGTFISKVTHDDGTEKGRIGSVIKGRWRIDGNYFVYSTDEAGGKKKQYKEEIYKISSRGFGFISTDGAICMELRVPMPNSTASLDEVFEKTPLIDKIANQAVHTNDIQNDPNLFSR